MEPKIAPQVTQSLTFDEPPKSKRKNEALKDIFFGSEIQNEARRVRINKTSVTRSPRKPEMIEVADYQQTNSKVIKS